MNVFEDLIVELKEENLLEQTVIDDVLHIRGASAPQEAQVEIQDNPAPSPNPEPSGEPPTVSVPPTDEAVKPHAKPNNGRGFYQKRAIAEISNLQMVEHVMTGVEREYMKIVPTPFDDFAAKKALNAFLQIAEDENSEAHAQAEFNLMGETEAWCTALADRDRKMPVSSLRQYCENSRPPLSSQALLALGRFYRNLPYTSSVRAKFDFIVTRLFTKREDDKRVCLFSHDEVLNHINALYKEWSSIALYGADEDDSSVLLTALSFEDLAVEAESASSFDQLIRNDFFGRVRLFKESINEMFFAPQVIASVIDSNVRVGNAYVRLIDVEREKANAECVHAKYGDDFDDTISDAAAQTLELEDLLRARTEESETEEKSAEAKPAPINQPEKTMQQSEALNAAEEQATPRIPILGKIAERALAVNKWFLVVCALLVATSVGIYFYSNFFLTEPASSAGVRSVDMRDVPGVAAHIKTAKVATETFYAVMQPSWDTLPKEKREQLLENIYNAGREKGYSQVNLMTANAKTAGYASAERMEVSP